MRHKCFTLDPVKVSATRTNLVCHDCGNIVGCWDDLPSFKNKYEIPDRQKYLSETEAEKLK